MLNNVLNVYSTCMNLDHAALLVKGREKQWGEKSQLTSLSSSPEAIREVIDYNSL